MNWIWIWIELNWIELLLLLSLLLSYTYSIFYSMVSLSIPQNISINKRDTVENNVMHGAVHK